MSEGGSMEHPGISSRGPGRSGCRRWRDKAGRADSRQGADAGHAGPRREAAARCGRRAPVLPGQPQVSAAAGGDPGGRLPRCAPAFADRVPGGTAALRRGALSGFRPGAAALLPGASMPRRDGASGRPADPPDGQAGGGRPRRAGRRHRAGSPDRSGTTVAAGAVIGRKRDIGRDCYIGARVDHARAGRRPRDPPRGRRGSARTASASPWVPAAI